MENNVGRCITPNIMSMSEDQFPQIHIDNKLPIIIIKTEIDRNFVQLNLPFRKTINATTAIPNNIVIEPKYKFKAISSKIGVGSCSSILLID